MMNQMGGWFGGEAGGIWALAGIGVLVVVMRAVMFGKMSRRR